VWISETALGTALNTSASQVGLFAIVMGVALLLTRIGFVGRCPSRFERRLRGGDPSDRQAER
jgi:hypothetical protein